MLVEPFAGDAVADNLNPVGRLFYGASTLVCVPVSLARNGPALGAPGEKALAGDYGRWRRVLDHAPCDRDAV